MRKAIVVIVMALFVFSVAGCATAQKQKDLEIQGLRNQISVLEAQVKSKDDELASMNESLAREAQEKEKSASESSMKKLIGEVKSRPNVKQIQIALRNAGYEPGSLDGKMGLKTKDAIKEFQKANGLKADGKVGKQTWKELKKYIYQKIK